VVRYKKQRLNSNKNLLMNNPNVSADTQQKFK
jgi:hypothetical protein